MFREMRRIKNQMSYSETLALLERGQEGVLGTVSENGYPYTVVVNYAYQNGKVYFHSAKEGHKISNILANDKVSFTVYDNVEVIEETFTTKYQSITLFGIAKPVPPSKEVLMALIKKYSPNFLKSGREYVNQSFTSTLIVEITIKHITGKIRD